MSSLAITADDRALCDEQSNEIDFPALDAMHLLGNYQRELPVNIKRMMENAHDWEHLPFVHPSSFAAIEKVSAGKWGWRTKVALPETGEQQLLQLLVDNQRNYWATTVLSGTGKGMHIHTQATANSAQAINIDVRFYVEEPFEDDSANAMVLAHMQGLYTRLYDEDQELMEGRQAALDYRETPPTDNGTEFVLGDIDELKNDLPKLFDLDGQRFCLNLWQGNWIVYSATCPHLLGPLGGSEIGENGLITCPWHGYRFDIVTGQNVDGYCGALAKKPALIERGKELFASVEVPA